MRRIKIAKGRIKMAPKITGIHHIALKAKGIVIHKKVLEFYHEILGLPIVREWGSVRRSRGCARHGHRTA